MSEIRKYRKKVKAIGANEKKSIQDEKIEYKIIPIVSRDPIREKHLNSYNNKVDTEGNIKKDLTEKNERIRNSRWENFHCKT